MNFCRTPIGILAVVIVSSCSGSKKANDAGFSASDASMNASDGSVTDIDAGVNDGIQDCAGLRAGAGAAAPDAPSAHFHGSVAELGHGVAGSSKRSSR